MQHRRCDKFMLAYIRRIETVRRYIIGGVIFGLGFPIGTWVLQYVLGYHDLTFHGILAMHRDIPINYVVDSAPLVLGMMGWVIGVKQSALEALTRNLQGEVSRRTEQLRLANDAKSQFLANMSHELRTPLNSILGFSEIMRDNCFKKETTDCYVEYSGYIHQSASHLLALINDILDLAKVEAGKIELSMENHDTAAFLQFCKRLFDQRTQKLGLTLDLQISPNTPRLYADDRATKQIMFNLLSNATKFTDKGGSISIQAQEAPDGGVEIVVYDTGCGIPPDQLDRVLRPFEQADNRYGAKSGGTGLGLTLASQLVGAHGGTLRLESDVSVGTVVRVTFPAAPEVPAVDPDSDEMVALASISGGVDLGRAERPGHGWA